MKVLLDSSLAICVSKQFNLRLNTLFKSHLKPQQCITAVCKSVFTVLVCNEAIMALLFILMDSLWKNFNLRLPLGQEDGLSNLTSN